jgi:hypothetical protein
MKKVIVFILLLLPVMVQGQESIFKSVPKQMSLEAGYRRITSSELTNQASNGFSILADYAWQLSGFTGGKASFISVPLGYTQMLADTDSSRSVRVISYGWTVRHELRPQSKGWVPYIGYALMINNYGEKGIDGHQFAHQTRFSAGLNRYNASSFQPYVQLDYSMTYYPQWGIKGSLGYKFVELKIGVRYMHKKA